MKKRERIYKCCGKVSLTFSQADVCRECDAKQRYGQTRDRIKKNLEDLGHTNVEFVGFEKYGKISVKFTHSTCGTTQTWSSSNITKALDKHPAIAPCSKCGAKRRTDAATKGYIAKYGMSPERLKEWEGYSRLVRRLSDATYRKYKAEINPHNHPRGLKTYHLDHKFPIIEGFLQGVDPEILADKSNLQMLPSIQNISKGRSL